MKPTNMRQIMDYYKSITLEQRAMAMVNIYSAVVVTFVNKVLHFTHWIGMKPIKQNLSTLKIFNRHIPVLHDTCPSFNKPINAIIHRETASEGD